MSMKFRTQNHIPNLIRATDIHLQDNLEALYVYGESFGLKKKRNSAHSLLLILKDSSIRKIHLVKPLYPFMEKISTKLTIFNREEFLNSLDAFPVEALDIQQTGKLLVGSDIVSTIQVDPSNLRLETEFYLRTNVLKLREAFIKGHTKHEELIRHSFPLLHSLFRALLSIHAQTPSSQTILEDVCSTFEMDLSLFQRILKNWEHRTLGIEFYAYLNELENLVKKVDDSPVHAA